MTTFKPSVRRKTAGRNHYYVDGNGTRMPGVTTILGNGLPKKALINWAANATADAAVNGWDELAELPVATRLDRLKRARYNDRDAAAKRGTDVHGLAEQLVKGERVTVPEELRGHVEAYVRFLDDWDVELVLVEFVVASYRYGYAGTCDLIADLTMPDGRVVRWLLDIKTTRSGVYGETALQLAAYRYADVYLTADGTEEPLPVVERTGVVHVRADGYSLVPVTAGEQQLTVFRYVQQVARFDEESRGLIGDELTPPHPDGEIARVIYERSGQ
ncbi:hypothetical protein F5X71_00275 [Nocardia brasiliensis]|uniref:PD-(D/E)XK endonuclease-like domain-containing protein n=1 Tax=Nocardia brasiliensis TaxID=37326 RepID=A0A6G9XJE5_NOCBR|nr:hypothetical protein [Nocardia brasiliensis]QIS00970.1 hypothetical protein F5X71_00275 [Nocardia brasiliensis]